MVFWYIGINKPFIMVQLIFVNGETIDVSSLEELEQITGHPKELIDLYSQDDEKVTDLVGHSELYVILKPLPSIPDSTILKYMVKKWIKGDYKDIEKKYGNIRDWDTSQVMDMSQLFRNAIDFNEDISDWDTGKVENMKGMFMGATAFNQDISNWNTSNVKDMSKMFLMSTSFDQDLSSWNIKDVDKTDHMFHLTKHDIPI